MNPPAWILLRDPVPPVVTARAVALLHVLSIGQAHIETVDVDCATLAPGIMTRVLKYACELHGPIPPGHKGITVYGLL